MKCTREEIAGSDGRKRWVFAMGRNEAVLIHAIVSEAKRHTPRVPETVTTHSRMTNIIRALQKAINEMPDDIHLEKVAP